VHILMFGSSHVSEMALTLRVKGSGEEHVASMLGPAKGVLTECKDEIAEKVNEPSGGAVPVPNRLSDEFLHDNSTNAAKKFSKQYRDHWVDGYVSYFHNDCTLTLLSNTAAVQKYSQSSASFLDETLKNVLSEIGIAKFTHLIYDKPHDEQWFMDHCDNPVKPSDYDARMALASCSMGEESCRDSDMLYQVCRKYTNGAESYDVISRVESMKAAAANWPGGEDNVFSGAHTCRAVCADSDYASTDELKNLKGAELGPAIVWMNQILQEDLGLA